MIIGCVSFHSVIAKRLHDLDETAWWIVVGIVALGFGAATNDGTIRSITSLLLFIAVVIVGSTKAKPGPNRFGPDPLGEKLPAKGPIPSEQSAYQKGQEFSNSLFEVFHNFMRERFEPVKGSYLDILKSNVRKALHANKVPPLTVARAEYRDFLDNVKEMEGSMLAEIKQYMHEWLAVAHQAGVREETERAFGVYVSNFTADLSMAGLKVLTDYAVPLQDADMDWRRLNPERAKQFPEPK